MGEYSSDGSMTMTIGSAMRDRPTALSDRARGGEVRFRSVTAASASSATPGWSKANSSVPPSPLAARAQGSMSAGSNAAGWKA